MDTSSFGKLGGLGGGGGHYSCAPAAHVARHCGARCGCRIDSPQLSRSSCPPPPAPHTHTFLHLGPDYFSFPLLSPKRSLALSAARRQVFIKELIQGSPLKENQKEFLGRGQAKHFLYQIVANKINGKRQNNNNKKPQHPFAFFTRCPRTQAQSICAVIPRSPTIDADPCVSRSGVGNWGWS